MLPKLQVTLEQGSRVPVGRARWTSGTPYIGQRPSAYPLITGPAQPFPTPSRQAPPLTFPSPRDPPPHSLTAGPRPLTAGPAAQQADAPLLAALRPLQLTLVAVGGGIRAAHGCHHAGAGALLAHAGGSARLVCAGLADGAEATQHSSARCVWGGRCNGVGQGPASATSRPLVITHTDQCLHTCPDLAYACPPMFVLVLTGTQVCPSWPGPQASPSQQSPLPRPAELPHQSLLCSAVEGHHICS